MMYIAASDPFVRKLINKTFPSFKGKIVKLHPTENISFTGTQWNSGYRRQYKLVKLDDMSLVEIPVAPFLRESQLHDDTFTLPPGVAVVVFQNAGMRSWLEIHANKDNLLPLLPKDVDLTEDEKTVLEYTRKFKSSYGGISQYRRHMSGFSKERWDANKDSLVRKGLLDSRGALTMDGKNVASKLSSTLI